MKLHNQALKYLSVFIFIIVSIWAAVFYFNMLNEINDSIDDSLARDKMIILQKIKRNPALIDEAGFDESNFTIMEITKAAAAAVHDHYADTVIYMPSEDEAEPFRMLTSAFHQNGRYFRLQVVSSTVEEDDLIEELLWSIVWLYGALLISIIVINNFVLKKLWKPFYSLLRQLQRFRLDRNDPLPAVQTRTKEFVALKAASDELINRATEAFNNQKQFTENAAHELQTPLAIITSKLELLLEKGTLDNSDANTVAGVLQVTERLNQLNKALLLLSKIENKQFADDRLIDFNHLVRQVAGDLREFSEFRQVSVAIDEAETLRIKMDTTLARMLVSNLLKNAIFHNTPAGSARVLIGDRSLTVCNTAENGTLNSADIFKRFYKSSPSSQSTGLGLSIVQAICNLYGFTVTYAFTGEHRFTVRFA